MLKLKVFFIRQLQRSTAKDKALARFPNEDSVFKWKSKVP